MFNKWMSFVRILYVKIRTNRITSDNQEILWVNMADLLNNFVKKRKMTEDFRMKMIITARKDVPL